MRLVILYRSWTLCGLLCNFGICNLGMCELGMILLLGLHAKLRLHVAVLDGAPLALNCYISHCTIMILGGQSRKYL